jgi:hypothetical protein
LSRKICPDGPLESKDSKLIPDIPPYLPAGAVQPPTYSALVTRTNPGASLCSSAEQSFDLAWRYFELPKGDGLTPNILVGRVRTDRPYREVTVEASRIGVETVGGKEMVIVKPFRLEPVDTGTQVEVVLPEDGGYLLVQSQGVAFDEVMRVAESIATGVAPKLNAQEPVSPPTEGVGSPSSPATGPVPSPPPPVENKTPDA